MIIVLLCFAVGYLAITSIILYRNRKHLTSLLKVDASTQPRPDEVPLVSICIPARNEENNIRTCVESVLHQTYPNLEILVLDDRSSDDTLSILHNLNKKYNNQLILLTGETKPDHWLGKSWACHQLANRADGKILIFIDADTTLQKQIVSRTVKTMGREVLDFLTIWPHQELVTFWEKMIIPLVYHTLLTTLPVKYQFNNPRWMPNLLFEKIRPIFAAACGQYMAFKRDCYLGIGGHRSVKNEIVEDVALSRKVVKRGFKMRMYHGLDSISCRMYKHKREIRAGFRKNFLAGFNYNITLFISAGLLHLIVFILPFVTLPAFILSFSPTVSLVSGLAIALIWLQRYYIARWFDWKPWYGLLHPISVIWFQMLGLRVLKDYLTGQHPVWKGRSLK